MKNAILSILFFYPVTCFCQQKVPVPLESVYVNLLLQKEQNNNTDSVNWIREFSSWRRRDSFNFYPQYSEIIINSIRDACGKKFYLLNDSAIITALKDKIDENCQSIAYQTDISLSDFKRYSNFIKSTPTPKIENQIWHPESRYIINYSYKKQQFDAKNKYINLINSISYDSSKYLMDGRIHSYKYLKNRDSIIDVIRNLKNNNFKFDLYLALIEKFVQLQCDEDDLIFLRSPIEDIFIRSGRYSPLQQATIYIAMGKAFNTTKKNAKLAFISFRYAEYILINNKLDYEHDKLQSIITDFISSQNEERYFAYLRQAIKPFQAEEAFNITYDKRNYISLFEFFQRVLRIANYENVIAHNEIRETGMLTNRRLLIVAGVIYSLSEYINDPEIRRNEMFIRKFTILLCDYYRLLLNTERASQIQERLILNTVNANDVLIKLKYHDDLKKLVDIERDKGKITLAKNLYIITEQAITEKIYYHPYEDYTFSFPSSLRLWDSKHFQTLIDSVGTVDTFHYGGYKQYLLREGLTNNFGLKTDELLKILGKWSIKQENWKAAAILLSKVDLARTRIDDEESSQVFSAAIFGEYMPDKYKKENTIKDLVTSLIVGGVVLAIILLLAVWAVRERERAKVSEAKAQLLSHTMDQIGHLAPQCIRRIIKKYDSSINSLVRSNLEKLSNMLDNLHFYSKNKEISYEDEYNLACSYVDLSYTSTEDITPSDKIYADYKDKPTLALPTFVLFNAIQNAFKHGTVDNVDNAKVHISLNKAGKGYNVTVTNPFHNEDNNSDIEKRSGIKFMEGVLRGYNPKRKNYFTPIKGKDTFILTYSYTLKN